MATITRLGEVEIVGPSREQVFEQAQRLLRIIGRGQEPVAIVAILTTPPNRGYRGGKDSWTISVNATISFAPTAMPVELFGDAA
jgi:hypothetical protein